MSILRYLRWTKYGDLQKSINTCVINHSIIHQNDQGWKFQENTVAYNGNYGTNYSVT